MRIAFLTTEYPSESTFAGGVASNTARTARLLCDRGHEVEVFTLSEQRGTVEHESILVHRVRGTEWLESIVGRTPGLRRYSGYAKVLSRSRPLAAALRRRHRERPFSVVQAVSNNACGLMASYCRVAPLVTFVAAYIPAYRAAEGGRLTPKERQRDRAEATQMRRSDAVYAPSLQHARYVREREGIPTEAIEYAYNFDHIAGRPWSPPEGYVSESYGLFFGRISVLKGCDRLARVLKGILRRHPEMRFVFVGNCFRAPDEKRFDSFIRDELAGLEGQVAVLPAQPSGELFRFVRHARFVALPSRADNLPNTVLEAMELQRVVVATRDASFEQVLEHGVSGWLASQDDDNELAEWIDRAWCMTADERQRMGQAAHRVLERFKSPQAVQRLEALYERVVSGWRPPPCAPECS